MEPQWVIPTQWRGGPGGEQVPEGRHQAGDLGELRALPPMEAGGPPEWGAGPYRQLRASWSAGPDKPAPKGRIAWSTAPT